MNCQRKTTGDDLDEILSPFSLPGCSQEKGKKKEAAGEEEEKKGKKKKRERRQKEWEGKVRGRNGLRKSSASRHGNGGGDEDLGEQMADAAAVAPFTPEEGSEMDSGSFRGALHPRKGVPRRSPLF